MEKFKRMAPLFGLVFGALCLLFVALTRCFTVTAAPGVTDTLRILLPLYLKKLGFALLLSAGTLLALGDISVKNAVKTTCAFVLAALLFQTVELFYNIEAVMELLRDNGEARSMMFPYVIWQYLVVLCAVEVLYNRRGVFEHIGSYFLLTALSFGVYFLLRRLLPALQPIYADAFQIGVILTLGTLLSDFVMRFTVSSVKPQSAPVYSTEPQESDEPDEAEIDLVKKLWGRGEEE